MDRDVIEVGERDYAFTPTDVRLLPVKTPTELFFSRRDQRRAARAICSAAILATSRGLRVSYSRDPHNYKRHSRYNRAGIGYEPLMRVIHVLDREGYIVNQIASRNSNGGSQSVLWALPKLMALASEHAGGALSPTAELIRLRDINRNLIEYRDTPLTNRMRRELVEHNEALATLNLSLPAAADAPFVPELTYLYRVFNHNFQRGGRMYASGLSYQALPKAMRAQLLLDGEPVAEPDYPSLHAMLLYDLLGKPMPEGDLYALDTEHDRELVKRAFMILLNSTSLRAANGAIRELGVKQPKPLIDALRRKHAAVADAFHADVGAQLQYADSQLMMTVLNLLRRQSIVALPVHDSLIAPASKRAEAEAAMALAYAQGAFR